MKDVLWYCDKIRMALSLPGQVSNLEIVRNGIWSFSKGFADSLRGAIELFFLDYKRAQQREQKLQQRDIDRELLLNRNSPVREVQNIAKRRALERREKERLRDVSGGPKKSEPNIIERTIKCCLLNGGVFAVSIFLFDNIFLPLVKTLLFIILAGSQERWLKSKQLFLLNFWTYLKANFACRADALWSYTQPVLSVAFSTLWVLPFFLLSKIVNAIWFQDIADLAFRSVTLR